MIQMFSIRFDDNTGEATFEPWTAGEAKISPDRFDNMIREVQRARARHDLHQMLRNHTTASFRDYIFQWVSKQLEWLHNLVGYTGGKDKERKPLSEIQRGDPEYDTWAKGYYDGTMALENFAQAVIDADPEALLPETLKDPY